MRRNKPKVSLIGPTYPFRGGIAQYNTQLHKVLDSYCDIQTISFKRMYPSLIYPGSSDKETSTVDDNMTKIINIIDVYSPISIERAFKKIIEHKSDIVVITWWTLFWQPAMAYLSKRLRSKGIKTILLCHNASDHDSNRLRDTISSSLLKNADGYVVHSTDDAKLFEKKFNKPVFAKTILPVYDHYPTLPNIKPDEKNRLNILFFGFIRPYKGLDVLLDAMKHLKKQDVKLEIVGEVWGDEGKIKEKIEKLKLKNINYNFEYVNLSKAAEYFQKADLVVLPYISASGSAVVSLAYYYNRPVLASKVGGLKDSVIENKTGWLFEPTSSKELAKYLEKISRNDTIIMSKEIRKINKKNTWEHFAKEILDYAEKLK